MSAEVIVILGGLAWANWSNVQLDADLTTPADGWTVEAENPTVAQLGSLAPGQAMVIQVDGVTALKGWLEQIQVRVGRSGGLVVSMSGRDLAAPLASCSAPASWSYAQLTLESLAVRSLAELGIVADVVAIADAKAPLPAIKIEPGESHWAILERYCKRLRVMPWFSPDGTLHLGRPDYISAPVATLIHGGDGANVKECSYTHDIAERASEITVLAQGKPAHWDDAGPPPTTLAEESSRIQGSAKDAGIVKLGLHRPLLLDVGELSSGVQASARAAWEVAQRAYRGETVSCTVAGAGPKKGLLWAPDQMVTLDDRYFGLSGSWWVSARKLRQSRSGGTATTLTLHRPGLLLPELS